MNESDESTPVPDVEPRLVRPPAEFAGTIDERVIEDIHLLVPENTKRDKSMHLLGLVALIGLGLATALVPFDDSAARFAAYLCFAMGFFSLFLWWWGRRGWARFMLGRVISGRIQGAGIVVDQFGGRAAWDEFCSARLNDSTAILFVFTSRKKFPPWALGYHGLPLHRSFFESEEAWQEVSQLIREQVRDAKLVAQA